MRNTQTIYEDTAMLTNTKSDVSVEAEVDNFQEGVKFNAYVATNKIPMRWNGKIYVGNMAGMEFTSEGPKFLVKKDGR